MPNLDEVAPNYLRAQQRWPDASTLAAGYKAVRGSFNGDSHGIVEQVKSFIECVCITIIGEFDSPAPSGTPTTTELLGAALSPLGLRNSRGASKLDVVLAGFNKIADGIQDMRNHHGPVAHGRDGFLDRVADDHARAFVHAGDAILGVLLDALEGKQPDLGVTREPYESFAHLNDRIDRAVTIVGASVDEAGDRQLVVISVSTGLPAEAIQIRVEPSRLLYGVDRSAYVEVLKTVPVVKVTKTRKPPVTAEPPEAVPSGAVPASAMVQLVREYRGALDPFRASLEAFLAAQGVDSVGAEVGDRCIDSLLATADGLMGVDWKSRDQLQASLKVASKRVLARFGWSAKQAEEIAERLLNWWRAEGPDTTIASLGVSFEQSSGEMSR